MSEQAWGFGLATITDEGTVLDTWYPAPALGAAAEGVDAPASLTRLVGRYPARRVHTELVRVEIDLASAPVDASDAYLRLHLSLIHI